MQDNDQKIRDMHTGRLIRILSHQLKRSQKPVKAMEENELTSMQKHVLKYILLETLHRDIYQKNLEEEFQIRKSTASGILKLMEKNGFIYRESVKEDSDEDLLLCKKVLCQMCRNLAENNKENKEVNKEE